MEDRFGATDPHRLQLVRSFHELTKGSINPCCIVPENLSAPVIDRESGDSIRTCRVCTRRHRRARLQPGSMGSLGRHA